MSQAKSAVSAAERDRKQLEEQLQAVSQGIEEATAALQDLQRQIKAAEAGHKYFHKLASICSTHLGVA